MPLNIKNEAAHKLATELAQRTGKSLTEVVTRALEDALRVEKARDSAAVQRQISDLNEIALHCATLYTLDPRDADEILGYDAEGIPG